MLLKVNKDDMAGVMMAIENYLRLDHDIVRSPIAYIMKRIFIIQTYGDYLLNVTPSDDMIARVLHLPTRTSS